MTTNTNLPRTTLLIAAARAMNVSDDMLHTIVDALIDFDAADYDDDTHRALHVLADSLCDSDDDFDDMRLELRRDLDMLDVDDIAVLNAHDAD